MYINSAVSVKCSFLEVVYHVNFVFLKKKSTQVGKMVQGIKALVTKPADFEFDSWDLQGRSGDRFL